jgi:hypothetical protein
MQLNSTTPRLDFQDLEDEIVENIAREHGIAFARVGIVLQRCRACGEAKEAEFFRLIASDISRIYFCADCYLPFYRTAKKAEELS